jgi:2-oxoglutarate/2-oxoacid ferredoxin oxidoreductase subunit alpha
VPTAITAGREGRRLVQGNEACALAALAVGCRFYAGYPITPSSEIAEVMARRLPDLGGVFVQMEDEIASIAACIGASLGGVKAMTATSGPGFSLMQEGLGYAALCEVPIVVVDVQRVGPSTGMPTLAAQGDVMQARWGTHGDHPVVVLAPASVADTYRLTVTAFNISERLRVPVVLLSDEVVAHTREIADTPDLPVLDRPRADGASRTSARASSEDPRAASGASEAPALVPPMRLPGEGHRSHTTGLLHDEHGFATSDPGEADRLLRRLHAKLEAHADWLTMVETHALEDADVLVIAYGSPARAARQAVNDARAAGVRAGLLKLETIWPFPAAVVGAAAARARTIVVPEMNLGQLVGEVERAAAGRARVVSLTRLGGELFTPAEIRSAVEAAR